MCSDVLTGLQVLFSCPFTPLRPPPHYHCGVLQNPHYSRPSLAQNPPRAPISLRRKVNVLAMGHLSLQGLFTMLLTYLSNFASFHSPTFSLYSSHTASLLLLAHITVRLPWAFSLLSSS